MLEFIDNITLGVYLAHRSTENAYSTAYTLKYTVYTIDAEG